MSLPILIYSDNINDYKGYVKEVLCCLQDNNLYISPKKYAFHCQEIKFLGYILSPEGQMDENKVKIIKN